MIWRRHFLLWGAVIALSVAMEGCASFGEITPVPQYTGRFEPPLTVGIPEETPLPPVRTEGLGSEEITAVRIYRQNLRAVVNITSLSVYQNRFKRRFPVSGTGSGFIFDEHGFVVTNYHVVKDAQSLIVTLYDGSNYRAKVVGEDTELDLAVLQFDAKGRKLQVLRPADSDRLQIGQRVFALGNPYGLEGTLTEGIVSGLHRPMQTASGFIVRNLIQSDAAINPGNSGGPLLNSVGEVVGINVMIVTPTGGNVGIGLSIPSNTAKRIVRQIMVSGKVKRGWIQINAIPLDAQLARAAGIGQNSGLLVTRVEPGGNAERAGLRDGQGGRSVQRGVFSIPVDGDVILAVNDQRISSIADYLGSLETTAPGDQATLTVWRESKKIQLQIVLAPSPH